LIPGQASDGMINTQVDSPKRSAAKCVERDPSILSSGGKTNNEELPLRIPREIGHETVDDEKQHKKRIANTW